MGNESEGAGNAAPGAEADATREQRAAELRALLTWLAEVPRAVPEVVAALGEVTQTYGQTTEVRPHGPWLGHATVMATPPGSAGPEVARVVELAPPAAQPFPALGWFAEAFGAWGEPPRIHPTSPFRAVFTLVATATRLTRIIAELAQPASAEVHPVRLSVMVEVVG